MRYTMNMEPQVPKVRSMFNSEMARSLEAKDCNILVKELSSLKEVNSPIANWAEAIGTRLQIRDFLLQQKGGLATLQDNFDPDIRLKVTNYLNNFDSDLSILTGDYNQDSHSMTTLQLKEVRLDRLMREPSTKLLELMIGFSSQDSDKVLSSDELVSRTVDMRNDFVERLWSAAQSYSEGNIDIARHELSVEMLAINSDLDTQISSLLKWKEEV